MGLLDPALDPITVIHRVALAPRAMLFLLLWLYSVTEARHYDITSMFILLIFALDILTLFCFHVPSEIIDFSMSILYSVTSGLSILSFLVDSL